MSAKRRKFKEKRRPMTDSPGLNFYSKRMEKKDNPCQKRGYFIRLLRIMPANGQQSTAIGFPGFFITFTETDWYEQHYL